MLCSVFGGKHQFKNPWVKPTTAIPNVLKQTEGSWPMRTIMLKGITTEEKKKRMTLPKDFSTLNFSHHERRGCVFGAMKSTTPNIDARLRNRKN